MSEPRLAIFDDARGQWGPMTDRRPVFALRTGAVTNRRRIERSMGAAAAALLVPAHLAEVMAEREPDTPVNAGGIEGWWRLVNGRWHGLSALVAERVRALPRRTALVQPDGAMIAAHVDAEIMRQWWAGGDMDLPTTVDRQTLDSEALLSRPWDILTVLDATLRADLDASDLPEARGAPPPGCHIVGEHTVRIAPDATVLPTAAFIAERGPIVVDRGARIEPFAALEGPCYVGPGSHLAAHAALRSGTCLGPRCKVGGELKHTIIQGHTNKAHLGYLGDSLVGEWSNLGADTNVSNLKNTYGGVRVQLESNEPMQDTGRPNHGPIIGDFVRTAIGTRLLTGSVVGTGCMLAVSDLAPKHVNRFTFRTDTGVVAHDLDSLLITARRMMGLHGVELTDAETRLIRRLHAGATARVA